MEVHKMDSCLKISVILIVTLFVVQFSSIEAANGGGCILKTEDGVELSNDIDWNFDHKIRRPVRDDDTPGTVVYTFSAENVLSITPGAPTQPNPDVAYVVYKLNAAKDKLTVEVAPEFVDYERNENEVGTLNTPVSLTCGSGTSNINFRVEVTLTNNNKPEFDAATGNPIKLPMPFPNGWPVTVVSVTDVDLDNANVVLTLDAVGSDMFDVGPAEKTGKLYKFSLVTKRQLILDNLVTFVATATDQSQSTSLLSTATITIDPDELISTPVTPVFSAPLYRGELDGEALANTEVVVTPSIDITDGFKDGDVSVAITQVINAASSDFEVRQDNSKVTLVLKNQLSEGTLKEPFIIIVVEAKNSALEKTGKTVIHLTLPVNECATTPEPTTTPSTTVPTTTECDCTTPTTETTMTTTECPTPVTCPETTVTTECPATSAPTDCPVDCTECPTDPGTGTTTPGTGPTECPETPVTTECPATSVPTDCPVDCTECPTDPGTGTTTPGTGPTECPETTVTTECPATSAPTECPVDCTECPTDPGTGTTTPGTGATECPVDCTECPTDPGTGSTVTTWTTECPPTVTCPDASTTTECPTTSPATDCPLDCTECPTEPPTECGTTDENGSTGTTASTTAGTGATECPVDCTECPTDCPATSTPGECTTGGTGSTTTGTGSTSEGTDPTDCSQCPTEVPTECTSPGTGTTTPGTGTTTSGTGTTTGGTGSTATTECTTIGSSSTSDGTTTPGPDEGTIDFETDSYTETIDPKHNGFVLRVAASADPARDIVYAIKSDSTAINARVTVDKTGDVNANNLQPGRFNFNITATVAGTSLYATTRVSILVRNTELCGDVPQFSHALTVVNLMENIVEELIPGMIQVNGTDCVYALLEGEEYFDIDPATGALTSKSIDREDVKFAEMPTPQVKARISVQCEEHTATETPPTSRRRDVRSADSYRSIDIDDVENVKTEMTLVAVIDDQNDNNPRFTGEYPLMVVGYPSQELLGQINPSSLITVHATDADTGINALIKYTIDPESVSAFFIHPRNGTIYVLGDDTQVNNKIVGVSARDLDGEGPAVELLLVLVRVLYRGDVSEILIEGAVLEDVDDILRAISADTKLTVRSLATSVIPSTASMKAQGVSGGGDGIVYSRVGTGVHGGVFYENARPATEERKVAGKEDVAGQSVLRMVVYAVNATEMTIVPADVFVSKMDDFSAWPVQDVRQLTLIESSTLNNDGLVAAVISLGVICILLVVGGLVALYVFYLRPKMHRDRHLEDLISNGYDTNSSRSSRSSVDSDMRKDSDAINSFPASSWLHLSGQDNTIPRESDDDNSSIGKNSTKITMDQPRLLSQFIMPGALDNYEDPKTAVKPIVIESDVDVDTKDTGVEVAAKKTLERKKSMVTFNESVDCIEIDRM